MPIKHLLPADAEHSVEVYGHMLLIACERLIKLSPQAESMEEALVYCYVRAKVTANEHFKHKPKDISKEVLRVMAHIILGPEATNEDVDNYINQIHDQVRSHP